MSTNKPKGAIQRLVYQACSRANALTKRVMAWLLRVLFAIQRPARFAKAGFVLPTVVMVTLVVTLLTSAIMVRSFDRAQSASNYRVNQEVLNAALPSLDRARAKINALFADPEIPKGTPGELIISGVFNKPEYTLGDEVQLQVAYEFNGAGGIQTRAADPTLPLEDEEVITTAWRFPVDTDNNGRFDSFTLYSVLFRTPPINNNGTFRRPRNPLEARALPLAQGEVSGDCAGAENTSASLVGNKGWFLSSGQIKRGFFVYVATVPITEQPDTVLVPPNGARNGDINDLAKYEVYQRGNRGFSALEYQQDQSRIPLNNNAVLYEDDLDIVAGPDFRINGRIFTNSNLFVTEFDGAGDLEFYQVSSPASCFYEPENAKIVVGGNVSYGTVEGLVDGNNAVRTHLYVGQGVEPTINNNVALEQGNTSVDNPSEETAYNTEAYERRISRLVEDALGGIPNPDTDGPQEVIDDIDNGIEPDQAFDRYFRRRTRRVPFAEVASGIIEPLPLTVLQDLNVAGNNALRPIDEWVYPFDPSDGLTPGEDAADNSNGNGFSRLELNFDGDRLLPRATEFEVQEDEGIEQFVGDRVQIGNNLPALRWKDGLWVGETERQSIRRNGNETEWDAPNEVGPRQRLTRVETLDDLGDIGRDGFWERAAEKEPGNFLSGEGGLRIVTGAGIYLPPNPAGIVPGATLSTANPNLVVWPDTMPVIPGAETSADPLPSPLPLQVPLNGFTDYPEDASGNDFPFLRMRASVIYHYKNGDAPIACIDNYYDPTDASTVLRTDNGKVYEAPTVSETTGNVSSYLNYLANQVYPNGRVVNPLLREALPIAAANRNIAEQSAVDAAICGLQIFDQLSGSLSIGGLADGAETGYDLFDDVIKETAFLDARQIKAIDADAVDPNKDADPASLSGEYTLPLEQREPLEVRATVIDIARLRRVDGTETNPLNLADGTTSAAEQEYMLPNSGIIYATRNDALPDISEPGEDVNRNGSLDTGEDTIIVNNRLDLEERVSANDFKLDPTRRPSGIMLINGARLARDPSYREVEKGLTLVSNLPVYVKGEFNPHENAGGAPQEEFNTALNTANYNNFYTRANLNPGFACRVGNPGLPNNGAACVDEWRPANILSDAVTLLSEGFQEGTRVDGDFDLRNNQTDTVNTDALPTPNTDGIDDNLNIDTADTIRQKRLENGFLNNDFAVNGLSSGAPVDDDGDITTPEKIPVDDDYSRTGGVGGEYVGSSYFNNFVTPVQRRVTGPEYVMEICRKLPVSECLPEDWVVGYDLDDNGDLDGLIDWLDVDRDGTLGSPGDIEANIQANQLEAVLRGPAAPTTLFTSYLLLPIDPYDSSSFNPILLGAGTTSRPAYLGDDRRYARRVAFLRHSMSEPLLEITQTTPSGLSLKSSNATYNLVLDSNSHPVPLGVSFDGTNDDRTGDSNPDQGALGYYPYFTTLDINVDTSTPQPFGPYDDSLNNRPRLRGNALWYQTTDSGTLNWGWGYPLDFFQKELDPNSNRQLDPGEEPEDTNRNGKLDALYGDGVEAEQPVLIPVLNIQYPEWPLPGAAPDPGSDADSLHSPDAQGIKGEATNWIQPASGATTFNMFMGTGDLPGRPLIPGSAFGEFNGGLSNLPRFLENWTGIDSNISGSLIQLQRSSYATAPYFHTPNKRNNTPPPGGPFGYPQVFTHERSQGQTPYFAPPNRNWGYDVGFLSQIPDLLTQQFSLKPASDPRQFSREVGRDDDWIEALLCARTLDRGTFAVVGDAVNADQRPDTCVQ